MVLGALAVATSRASLGALVACNSYRNPDLHADMARTIDHVSDGRFVLGIGAGWFDRDYEEYGYEVGSAGDRAQELAEALPRMRARMRRANPGPVRGAMPLLVAGGGERVMLRLVAEHADLWNCYGPRGAGAQERDPRRALRAHRARPGRDRAHRAARGRRDRFADGYLKAGMTHLIVTLSAPRYDVAQLERCAPGATGRPHDDAHRHPAGGERRAGLRRGRRAVARRAVRARARARARAARDVLAQGLHPAHAPLPRRLPLLHVRAAAAARRALLPDARRGARDRPARAARPAATRRSSRSATSPSCATARRARSSSGSASRPPPRTSRTARASCCARPGSCRTPTPASSTTTSCSPCARSAPRRGSCSRPRARACRSAARRTSARPTSCPRCASTRSTAPGASRSRTRAAS